LTLPLPAVFPEFHTVSFPANAAGDVPITSCQAVCTLFLSGLVIVQAKGIPVRETPVGVGCPVQRVVVMVIGEAGGAVAADVWAAASPISKRSFMG
jgi:hypothetical protein